MTSGKFITLEGSEGAGKTTALSFISDFLHKAFIEAVITREPGGTVVAEGIRDILLQSSTTDVILPETELLLMFAGRAQHIRHCIQPALLSGKWVISDRFIDASYAYQGGGRGIETEFIQALDQRIVGSLYPDLTILLDIPVELGLERAFSRQSHKDRIEQEKLDFFIRVRNAYLARAKQDPQRIKIVDASLEIEEVEAQIHGLLDAFLRSVP